MMFFKKAFVFVLFGFISATELHASATEDSKGLGNSVQVFGKVVSKKSQEPLAGATVTLVGTTRGTISDENGEFLLKNLNPQKYTLRVTYIGYKTTQKQIDLSKSQKDIQTIEFALQKAAFDMDAIVVTASLGENMLKNTPQLTEVLSGKVLQTTGAITVQDALEQNVPGIEFSEDSHGSNIQMQGLGTKYILILIDGERMSQKDRDNIDFERLNVGQIERIEVTKGAASSIYGSNAIGGVINIITKKPKHAFEANGFYRRSAYNEQVINGYVATKQDHFSASLGADHKKSDGYDLTLEEPNTSKTQEKFEDYSITPFFSFRPSDQFELNLKGNYFVHERFDELSTIPTHPKDYSFTLNANANYYLSPKQNFWISWNTDQYEQYHIEERKNNNENLEGIHRFNNAKLISHTHLSLDHSFKVGLEYLNERLTSDRVAEGKKTTTSWIGFIYNEYKPFTSLRTSAALQVNQHSTFGMHVSPSLSLLYQVLPLNIRLGYSNGYRAPTLKELYFEWDHFSMFFIKGNTDLKPETSHYFYSSVEYITSSMNLSASVYLNRLNNMITTVTSLNNGQQTENYQNVADARLIGFNLQIKRELIKRLTLIGGYSYVHSEDLNTGFQIPGIITQSARLRLEYGHRFSKDFDLILALQGKYSGGVLDESINDLGKAERDQNKLYWNWRFISTLYLYKYFNLALGVDNLFDYTDTEDFSTLSPGRRFFSTIRYSFN